MSKQWGRGSYWGLGGEFDPDWLLTPKQMKLRDDLIQLCKTKIRPHSVDCDRNYTYPRASLDALADLGLLGLIVPEEFGGLGESHLCCSMIVETLARYGCPSTAMIYTMHLTALAMISFRYHDNEHIKDLLKRINKDKLIGTSVHSDPSTGGHFWFPLSSKTEMLDDDTIKVLKYGSWATSAGLADWYAVETVSPKFNGDFSDLSVFIIYKDEVRASTDDWEALGLHGNQSGPMIVDAKLPMHRMVGPLGDGQNNNQVAGVTFLLNSTSVWNGISLACMDVAKKHVTRKAHADSGMRICDYPTIQDYFGKAISETNGCRSLIFMIGQILDKVTNDCDWSIHKDPEHMPRAPYGFWVWQAKHNASENVNSVSNLMLKACGGTGYKTELGIERLLRDGTAGCIMAPSNEVIRGLIGKVALIGAQSLDFWSQNADERLIHNEVTKMTPSAKRSLAEQLLRDADQDEGDTKSGHPNQDTDFENPFSTSSPATFPLFQSKSGVFHGPGLDFKTYKSLVLKSWKMVTSNMNSFVFSLPSSTDHTGCLPGQYVQVRITTEDGKEQERYFSPVSRPSDFGLIEIVLRFESQGLVSQHFEKLVIGDKVDFRGPCGGFEYKSNSLDELTILAAGAGVTPAMQLIRCIMDTSEDKTRVALVYFSDNPKQILYKEELDQYAKCDPRMRIVYTVGEAPENWDGEEGFIDTVMLTTYIPKPNCIKHKIVMCGGPSMTISCLHSLRTLGYDSESIFIFGQFGTELVRKVYGRNAKLSTHRSEDKCSLEHNK